VSRFRSVTVGSQKKTIDTLAAKLWNEVDEIRKLGFADRLKQQGLNKTALTLAGLLLFPMFYSLLREHVERLIAIYAALFLCLWIGPFVLAWTVKKGLQTLLPVVLLGGAVVAGITFQRWFGMAIGAMVFYGIVVRPLYIIVLYVCAACVSGAELILRRVAEYPKGAVAAVGIVLTFISAFVKFTSSS
jgi:hypothetical protein